MKGFLVFALFLFTAASSTSEEASSHNLVKRQLPSRNAGQRSIPLSRSRQFPPPEELEESELVDEVEDINNEAPPAPARRQSSLFRGRQQPPDEKEEEELGIADELLQTEAPPTTTAVPSKTPNRITAFNRNANRPRFGSGVSSTARTSPPPASARQRVRLTSAPAERIDVTADILNKPPPPRPASRSTSGSRANSRDSGRKPVPEEASSTVATRRAGTGRGRARGRYRTKTSTSTTTTTTTTTPAPVPEEYYYYYYDEDEAKKPLATTSTTTTTSKPAASSSIPRRPSLARKPSVRTTERPPENFDPESQFQAPPDDVPVTLETRTTKRFTTTSTTPAPPGGIPPHLRSKYKPRTDGRFVDYLRDPNRPRELKGFDLTNYPFYIRVPEDIEFDCEDKKDGYYASIPHHCQLFHYCFAGARYDFLCANYTLYDQTTFTCRFANNVDCESSDKFYYRNDDLWKETTTAAPEEPKKKKATTTTKVDEEDYEDEDYDDYYEDEEEEERKRKRPRRRRNRRKNQKQDA